MFSNRMKHPHLISLANEVGFFAIVHDAVALCVSTAFRSPKTLLLPCVFSPPFSAPRRYICLVCVCFHRHSVPQDATFALCVCFHRRDLHGADAHRCVSNRFPLAFYGLLCWLPSSSQCLWLSSRCRSTAFPGPCHCLSWTLSMPYIDLNPAFP